MVCRNFILPEFCKLCLFFFLRNLFYLITPDEVRMLDNRLALVLIRGEAPVIDAKYDLTRHPNIKRTADGGAAPYTHNARCLYDVGDLDFTFTSLDEIEIIENMEESL